MKSTHSHAKAKATPVHSILHNLKRPSAWCPSRPYVSDLALRTSITLPIILEALENSGVARQKLASLAQHIRENQLKIFCILCEIDAIYLIATFKDIGFTDTDLPLGFSAESDAAILRSSSQRTELRTSGWTPSAETLVRIQWEYLSPVFDQLGQHVTLHDLATLPTAAVTAERKAVSDSWIAIAAFEPSHLPLCRLNAEASIHNPEIPADSVVCAIKRSKNRIAFKAERSMLAACNSIRHEHIVRLLASFTWQNSSYLLLPLATQNLEAMWLQTSPAEVHDLIDWSLVQIFGLADAIHTIHSSLNVNGSARFGLHGDVKATNVLVFNHGAGFHAKATLRLADFEESMIFATLASAEDIPSCGMLLGTYGPPECVLEAGRSQVFDMWGLGCLILEFVTWLTYGGNGLNRFSKARKQVDYGFGFKFSHDYFFDLSRPREVEDNTGNVIAGLNPGVIQCIADLRSNAKSATITGLITLIERDLLQVKPGQRKHSSIFISELGKLLTPATLPTT